MSDNEKTVDNAEKIADGESFADALKPAASWQTSVGKVLAGAGIAFSACVTFIGVKCLLSGKKFGDQLGDEEFGKAIAKLGGGVMTTLGGFGLATNYVAYSNADAASRARNFVELQEKLNQREQNRGRK